MKERTNERTKERKKGRKKEGKVVDIIIVDVANWKDAGGGGGGGGGGGKGEGRREKNELNVVDDVVFFTLRVSRSVLKKCVRSPFSRPLSQQILTIFESGKNPVASSPTSPSEP